MANSTSKRRKTSQSSSRKTTRRKNYARTKKDFEVLEDIKLIIILAVAVFLFICNFGLIGTVGSAISNVLFGVFGILNYIVSFFTAFIIVYLELTGRSSQAVKKSVTLCVLFLLLDMICDLIGGITRSLSAYSFKELFDYSYSDHKGGGIIAASINYGLLKLIDIVGTILVITVLIIICVIILTEKSVLRAFKDTQNAVKERTSKDNEYRAELYEERKAEADKRREERRLRHDELLEKKAKEAAERKALEKSAKDDNKILKRNKKVSGVTFDTKLSDINSVNEETSKSDDVHEIILNDFEPSDVSFLGKTSSLQDDSSYLTNEEESAVNDIEEFTDDTFKSVDTPSLNIAPTKKLSSVNPVDTKNIVTNENKVPSEYVFPPRSLLVKGVRKAGDSAQIVKQTAAKLQDTLAVFGVEATVTDISQGPTVTRYELQPKLGVKVSRIKNLSDDIKLSLAASEIRIEAPIPGKSAIGVEVPNKEAQPVYFRDLIDTPEYDDFDSKLAFAVGKDIAGKTIVYGVDNFPHLLIAGATGSGKSVCINTLIMSIIYKASPDDVKLIMIDPKVVELSVYNGIPHLMLPVVTDVKKAAATLNFAVNEMQERYKKFAEVGARDLTGYNRFADEHEGDSFIKRMPKIVIIVDEVAELMLQEKKSVEDSICSLAQLARAAGIHLIIATQRPSVDVITGLIKANMPSRIAFAVSSGVDSRTILDMGGAEELLGKGDMLFFPKGLKKPVRLQGGFISDKEVSDVVEFLKKHGTPSYDASVQEKIENFASKSDNNNSGSQSSGDGDSSTDELFADAGYFIIETQKASIGWLQRKFKIGFNRAARIMDQLADAGVVGPDCGTKPREILMSRDSFENYLEQN